MTNVTMYNKMILKYGKEIIDEVKAEVKKATMKWLVEKSMEYDAKHGKYSFKKMYF